MAGPTSRTAGGEPAAPQLAGRAGPAPDAHTLALPDGPVLAYWRYGPDPASTPAAAVVLVHGWTQDHTSWADVSDRLVRRHPDVPVIAYDARGHGRSDAGPRDTATIDHFADDLAVVVETLVPDGPVVLAGHSLGGPVIMAFAERHPDLLRDRIAGVGLVATSAGGLGRDLFGLSGRLTAPALLAQPVITRVRSWSRAKVNLRHPALLAPALRLGLYGPGAATARNRRRTAAQVARSHPATTAALVSELVAHDRVGALAVLDTVPTVVFAGTKDGLCPMAHSRAMADAMPHADFAVYPRAGHMLPYERPTELADRLAALARPVAATLARDGAAELG